MHLVLAVFSVAVTLLSPAAVLGQKLPPPSREVFKCVDKGKVIYADSPCLGAAKVDVEPPRGMDTMTGQQQTGRDIRNERMEETITEAVKPILGETVKQRATRQRRFKLSASDKLECARLDKETPVLESVDSQRKTAAPIADQQKLLGLRMRYRKLGC